MSLRAVCRRCGYVWQYSGQAKYATCPYCMGKTPVRLDSLREWHDANRPAIVMRGGYTYVVVPRDDDLGGFLPGVLKLCTIAEWQPIEEKDWLLIPTYAYDRAVMQD